MGHDSLAIRSSVPGMGTAKGDSMSLSPSFKPFRYYGFVSCKHINIDLFDLELSIGNKVDRTTVVKRTAGDFSLHFS